LLGVRQRAHAARNRDRSSPSKVDHQLSKKKSGPSVAERHCARSRPTTGRGNAWVQPRIIALGRPNLREKAATTADKLKCIGRWRSARNRTSRPLRGLPPIDVQTAMPRSRRHSSRNICRATSWNIIGDVRGVMSPGRAVSIPCWRRGAGRGPMSRSQRRRPRYSISVTFSIGDFFAELRRSTHSKKTPAEAGAKLPQIV
jgi:hypothetical protein